MDDICIIFKYSHILMDVINKGGEKVSPLFLLYKKQIFTFITSNDIKYVYKKWRDEK